jgi:hypothetical protein
MGFWSYFGKWIILTFSKPFAVTDTIVTIVTLVCAFIVWRTPRWEVAMKSLLWIIPLTILGVILIASFFWASYSLYHEQQQELRNTQEKLRQAEKLAFPTVEELMMQRYFNGVSIPLSSLGLGLTDLKLTDKTFEKCHIKGPAVLYVGNRTTIMGNTLNGDAESCFIVTTNTRVWGVINLENVTFIGCDFTNVSFVGTIDQITKLKNGFGVQ